MKKPKRLNCALSNLDYKEHHIAQKQGKTESHKNIELFNKPSDEIKINKNDTQYI